MSENATPSATEEAKRRLQEMRENRDPNRVPTVPATPIEKDIRPVAAKPKKKKFGQKLREAMFSEDIGNGSVTEYVFFRVMIPAVKRVLSDMANTAINMALGLDPKTRTVGANHTANASVYRDRNFNQTASNTIGNNRRDALSDFVWDEETATDIYNQCIDILDRYPTLSVGNVYSIMGMPQYIRATDKNWGWGQSAAQAIEMVPVDVHDHTYRIVFPPVRPI